MSREEFIFELSRRLHVHDLWMFDWQYELEVMADMVKDIAKSVNQESGTSYDLPEFRDFKARIKECKHCGNMFIDVTTRNQSPTCSLLPARLQDGRYWHHNGRQQSQCYQEYRNAKRRLPVDGRRKECSVSVPDYLLVYLGDKMNTAVDDKGKLFKSPRRNTTHYDELENAPIHVRFSSDKETSGVIGDFGKVLDPKRYRELSSDYKPGRVHTTNVFNNTWQKLPDGIKRIYRSESNFDAYKERAECRGVSIA